MTKASYPSEILPAGTQAPDFRLPSSGVEGSTDSLSRYAGQPVVLVFYPGDWTPVCTDQLTLYSQILAEFKKFNAQVFGISVDSVWSHIAYARARNLKIPLLADFEPKGEVSRTYGVYNQREGRSKRALFVIDHNGVIAWSHLSPDGVNPGADGILRALQSLDARKD